MKIWGNRRALERIGHYGEAERLPHSILLFGDSGTGKRTLADYIAMLYFCIEKSGAPCMKCSNCERIEKHIHPDTVYIDCGNTSAEELRETLLNSAKMPVEGQMRVYILTEFQLFNRECQNALLTYLEEPSDRVRFILTASNKNGVLPTILSRTAVIRTEPLSLEECASALREKGEKDSENLAELYGGNLGLALKAAKDKYAIAYIESAKAFVAALCDRQEYKALIVLQKLPQPKEDKREPIKQTVLEASKIIHDGFSVSEGGKGGCGCDKELAKRLAKEFSPSVLNRLCRVCNSFSSAVTEVNFNGKMTSSAFTAGLFKEIEHI